MTISSERRKWLAERLRTLAAREDNVSVAEDMLRRADLVEAGIDVDDDEAPRNDGANDPSRK